MNSDSSINGNSNNHFPDDLNDNPADDALRQPTSAPLISIPIAVKSDQRQPSPTSQSSSAPPANVSPTNNASINYSNNNIISNSTITTTTNDLKQEAETFVPSPSPTSSLGNVKEEQPAITPAPAAPATAPAPTPPQTQAPVQPQRRTTQLIGDDTENGDENNDVKGDDESRPRASPAVRGKVNERIDKAEARIAKDKYDTEAWTTLMGEVNSLPIDQARPYYERFFELFPTAGRYWKLYAEHEMRSGNFDAVEKIFMRCLLQCLNVELWRCYLNYIKTIKKDDRAEIQRAYEFALAHVGMDVTSTPIWTDYLDFLKSEKTSTPYEEGQKMTQLRKLYSRAIQNPMHNLDKIWDEYEAWERKLNEVLAKAKEAEFLPKFKAAWAKYKEKKNLRDGLLMNMLARPPRGSPKEEEQVTIWKQLIHFEKKNTQRLTPQELKARVTFMYNQALLCLYHYPEIWYDAAMYLIDSGFPEEGKQFFERSIKALPDNILLHFAYADFEEGRKNIKEAKAIYEKLLEHRTDPIVFIQYQKFSRRAEGMQPARDVFIRARKSPNCTYHVYVASALMEFTQNNEATVAQKVFELGLKQYANQPEYVLEYINLLKRLNDKNNLRVLFERVLASIPKEKSIEIWNQFLEFEYTYGDPVTIAKAEKRRNEIFPNLEFESALRNIVNRFRFMDQWPCSPEELEHMETSRLLKSDKDISAVRKGATHIRPDLSQMAEFRPDQHPVSERVKAPQQQLPLPPPPPQQQPQLPPPPQIAAAVPVASQSPPPPPPPAQIIQPQVFVPYQGVNVPEAVARLLALLPPPHQVKGPLPDINYVFDVLANAPLPPYPGGGAGGGPSPIPPPGAGVAPPAPGSRGSKHDRHDRHHGGHGHGHRGDHKRRRFGEDIDVSDSDSEDEGPINRPASTAHNVYRHRKQQKLPKYQQ